MQRSALRVISFTERHASVAADAYRTYGRGHHPASLNFGDCMTYAVARLADAPLLFAGNDFRLTDLPAAVT
jgi:ribonuclease VapC